MRTILVTKFPTRFVEDTILPELAKRVDVVAVLDFRKFEAADLRPYAPDLVLVMHEMSSHSDTNRVTTAAARAGVDTKFLSRKKATWSFIPVLNQPKEKDMNDQKPATHSNGSAKLGDVPGLRAAFSQPPPAPGSAIVKPTVDQLPAFGEFASALRFHGEAMLALAAALTSMPAPIVNNASSGPKPAIAKAKKRTVIDAIDSKLMELVEKFGGCGASELHVLVVGGGGTGGGIKEATRQQVFDRLGRMTTVGLLRREGSGGQDPFRYFVKENDD